MQIRELEGEVETLKVQLEVSEHEKRELFQQLEEFRRNRSLPFRVSTGPSVPVSSLISTSTPPTHNKTDSPPPLLAYPPPTYSSPPPTTTSIPPGGHQTISAPLPAQDREESRWSDDSDHEEDTTAPMSIDPPPSVPQPLIQEPTAIARSPSHPRFPLFDRPPMPFPPS